MKIWNPLIVSLLLVLGVTSETVAHDAGGCFEEMLIFSAYRNESAFIVAPALLGGLISALPAFVVGGAGYVITYGTGLPFGKEKDFSMRAAAAPGFEIVRLGSSIASAPFFILEKVLVNLTHYLFKFSEQITPLGQGYSLPSQSFVIVSKPEEPLPISDLPCTQRPTVDPKTGRVRLNGTRLSLAAGYSKGGSKKYCDENNK